MKYKNISQRAKRYAAAEKYGPDGFAANDSDRRYKAAAFADGYRLAMKEIRTILVSTISAQAVENFVTDWERLK